MTNPTPNRFAFDAEPSKRHKDANGFLHVSKTPISKAAVNPYLGREIPRWQELGLDAEAIYYGLRDPEELKKAADTFNGLPLLQGHYAESAEYPNKNERVGSTGTSAVYEHPYLYNAISITDAKAIAAVEDETCKELSSCYKYRADFSKPGEYEGAQYDFVMRDINGNHVALVPDGRAGPDVLVADEMPAALADVLPQKTNERNVNMKKKTTKNQLVKTILAMDEAIQNDPNASPEVKEQSSALMEIAEEIKENIDTNKENLSADGDIDLSLPVEDIIKDVPGLEGEALEFVKKLIGKLQSTNAIDNMPDENKLAADAVTDEVMNRITAALKSTPNDELWAAFHGLMSDVDKTRSRDIIDKIIAAMSNTPTGDNAGEIEKKKEDGLMAADANTIKKEVADKFRSLSAAERECRSILGNQIDAYAFDSAEDIYALALKQIGIDCAKYPKSAYKGMVDMHKKSQAANGLAFDAKQLDAGDDADTIFKNISKIKQL